MTSLALAAVFFVGIHLFVAGTGLRDRIVGALGEPAYLGLFSVFSLGGIVWLSMAFGASAPSAPWWAVPELRTFALVAVFFAFQGVVLGLTTKSPTSQGGDAVLDAEEPATGILRVTRHPFLWGAALWAFAHVLVNPDPPSFVFFGALLVLTLAGPASIDAKRARKHGERWTRFTAVTSNVPFAAILSGRNHLALGELGLWRVALGVVLYAVFLGAHARLFTASPF